MPIGGTLISVNTEQYDRLQRLRVTTIPVGGLSHHDKVGDLVDVVCDDDYRECEARIVSITVEDKHHVLELDVNI